MSVRRLLLVAGAFACACACALSLSCSGGSKARSNAGGGGGGAEVTAGGGSGGGGGGGAAESTVVDLPGARAAIGKRVLVVGVAQNAKLAAAIEGEAGDVMVYCLDRDSWPRDLAGTRIAVSGTLEWTEEFASTTSPTGEISAGTDGGVFVIRQCAPASTP